MQTFARHNENVGRLRMTHNESCPTAAIMQWNGGMVQIVLHQKRSFNTLAS